MAEPPSKRNEKPVLSRNVEEKRPLAVALSGEDGESTRVVARGEGALAEQILSLAFSHGVKVRQDAALAEILSTLEPESEIPPIALAAVAEILNHLYQAERRYRSDSSTPTRQE
ncbi:EscU/YscU/HrcU family type III secretion system export apparatus switch protein [Fodinicurvata halophila]|uniref:EscU/YscU/HrcU family type III secretion system export apparatus switch protein n=1 Tax=Fodinicurvata halophila TaxID=1419723 RepID=A0ABV8UJX9_9PROT